KPSTPHTLGPPLAFRRLRPQIWYAFISARPDNRRLLHRTSGAVWLLPSEPPGDPGEWIQVDVIPEDEQRSWGEDLVRRLKFDQDPDIIDALRSPEWYRALSETLGLRGTQALSSWNRLRSQRVQLHVEGWCERNNVSRDVVFE